MKQFRFPLDRVLAWRRTQARVEEAKLEALQAELRGIGVHAEKISRERGAAGRVLLTSGYATGAELALLDAFRKAADAEGARLESAQADLRRRIDAQMQAVVERRKDVKLLERLQERKLAAWQADYAREVEHDAAEAYLARWNTR